MLQTQNQHLYLQNGKFYSQRQQGQNRRSTWDIPKKRSEDNSNGFLLNLFKGSAMDKKVSG